MRALWILTVLGLLALVAWLGSRWALRIVASLAVVIAAVAVARSPSQEAMEAKVCRNAERASSAGNFALAREQYLEILGQEEFRGGYLAASRLEGEACAVSGLKAILAAELADEPACQGANRLLATGARAEAEEVFVSLLSSPVPDTHECAQAGLDRARRPTTGENTFDEVVVQGADNFAKRLTAALGTPAAPGPITWGVLVVALVVLYRGLEIINARRDPVPVAIAEIAGASSDDGGAPEGDGTIRTLLRDRLSRTGLVSPSTIPGLGGKASGLLEHNPFADVGWIGKAVGFLVTLAVPPRGVKVSATTLGRTRGEDTECGLAVDVTDVRTGRALLVRTVWGKDLDEAVDRTAYAVAQHAMDRCRTLPPWTYWGDPAGESLFFFERGRDALGDGDLEEASDRFGQAANSAPANALARLELAEIREMNDDFLDAIIIYLDAAKRYEQLFQARYRLAVALNFVESWVTHWSSDPVARRRVTSRLTSQDQPLNIPADGAQVVPSFLALAHHHIVSLKRDLRIRRLIWWCRKTAYRRLFWPLLVPFGPARRRMCSKVDTVGLAIRIRLAQVNGRPLDAIVQEMKAAKVRGWQAHYNLACCYAMLLEPSPALTGELHRWEQRNDANAILAVNELRAALSDPGDPLPVAVRRWLLQDDPDLAALRRHHHFSDWAAILQFPTSQDQRETTGELEALTSGWQTFAASARQAAGEWAERATMVAVAEEDLRLWSVSEQKRWALLGRWAAKPTSRRRQIQLATACDVQLAPSRSAPPKASDEDLPTTSRSLREHADYLNRLAPRLESGWRKRAERSEGTGGDYGNPRWIGQAAALWSALEVLAECPHDRPTADKLEAAVARVLVGFETRDGG